MNTLILKYLVSSVAAVSLTMIVGCSSNKPTPTSTNLPPPKPVVSAAPAAPAAAPAVARPEQTAAASPATTSTSAPSGPAATMSVETGLYRCEFGARVTVKRIAADRSSILINWKGKDVSMRSVASQSGALRFEEASSGLVWMAIVGKSQLLDSKKGQRLANECNL
jgi:membrane-bound inhibitor of C-type lysozyme